MCIRDRLRQHPAEYPKARVFPHEFSQAPSLVRNAHRYAEWRYGAALEHDPLVRELVNVGCLRYALWVVQPFVHDRDRGVARVYREVATHLPARVTQPLHQQHAWSVERTGRQYHHLLSLIHISEPTRLGMISY